MLIRSSVLVGFCVRPWLVLHWFAPSASSLGRTVQDSGGRAPQLRQTVPLGSILLTEQQIPVAQLLQKICYTAAPRAPRLLFP